ncbi:MAG TPA: hypothetical protein VIN58_10975, partial [Roseateles sp.]
ATSSHVTLKSAGMVDVVLAADQLDVQAQGAIKVREKNGLHITQLDSRSHAAIDVETALQGDVDLQAALTAQGSAAIRVVVGDGDLTATQAIRSATGNVTLSASGAMDLGAQADITTAGGNIVLFAGSGAMDLTAETYVDAAGGTIDLHAGGRITLGKLRSQSHDDLVVWAGGVVDGGEGDTDIIAEDARLFITSHAGIGTQSNPIEIQVAKLKLVNTGSGDIALEEVDGVEIEGISQSTTGSINITTRAGSIVVSGNVAGADIGSDPAVPGITLYAGGGAIDLGASITSGGRAVNLVAENGNLTLGAGISANKASGNGGTITLRAVQGSILDGNAASLWLRDGSLTNFTTGAFEPDLDWLLTHGKFQVNAATGAVTADRLTAAEATQHGVSNGTVLRQAGGAYLQSTGGRIVLSALHDIGQAVDGMRYSPLAIYVSADSINAGSTNRENVSVVASGAISVGSGGASGARAGSTDVISLAGKQTLSSSVDANGENIDIAADDLDVLADVRSAGAELRFRSITPDREIVLGQALTGGDYMLLAANELSRLKDGFSRIVFGADGSSNAIMVTGTQVEMKDDLVFYTNGEGGHVDISAKLVAPSLTIYGSGDTTTLAGDMTTAGDIFINDSVRISGHRMLTATNGGITLGGTNLHYLGGDSVATTDELTLDAGNGNVHLAGRIGGGEEGSDLLNKLDVLHAQDVVFDQDVTIDGDLTIQASGVVTFTGNIRLLNGGSLKILGASQIVLKGSVVLSGTNAGHAGDITLEGDEIDLRMSEAQVVGHGMLTLRPTTVSQSIAIASPASVGSAGVLNLEAAELRTLADGFSGIVIGHQDGGHALGTAGAVSIGARSDVNSLTFSDDVTIYGATIAVTDYADATAVLRLGGNSHLTLDASNLITISNEIEAHGITLVAGTSGVRQVDAGADGLLGEALRAVDLTVTSTGGVSLNSLEVHGLNVTNSGSGAISLTTNAARDSFNIGQSLVDGSVQIERIAQLSATESGAIEFTSQGGDVTVLAAGAGVSTLGGGSISLKAMGAGAALHVQQLVTSVGGQISL